jgi:hypothetical protein
MSIMSKKMRNLLRCDLWQRPAWNAALERKGQRPSQCLFCDSTMGSHKKKSLQTR